MTVPRVETRNPNFVSSCGLPADRGRERPRRASNWGIGAMARRAGVRAKSAYLRSFPDFRVSGSGIALQRPAASDGRMPQDRTPMGHHGLPSTALVRRPIAALLMGASIALMSTPIQAGQLLGGL